MADMKQHKKDYQEFRRLIQRAVDSRVAKEDLVWTVVDGIASIIDGATGAVWGGVSGGALQGLRNAFKHLEDVSAVPNPWFVWNGHADDDAETRYTKKYLRNRSRKGLGGTAFGLVGAVGSIYTQVDVAGIASHGNASGSTIAHLVQLRGIAAKYRQSRTISKWLDLVIRMKAMKLGVRGTQLAGAAIPVGAVGIATGVGAAAARIGITLTHTKICAVTAADIHWRAYQEQAISGGLGLGRGKVGPASKIMYELFAKRNFTRVFGKYDVDRLIREPVGWNAVNDKLMLI